MDRAEFEKLRDLRGKYIVGDIVLKRPSAGATYFESDRTPIENTEKAEAFVIVRWNPETESKTVNVHVAGVGPICRLDVDGLVHPPAGRHHKHALRFPTCPGENLKRDVQRRDDLAGSSIQEIFAEFCRLSNIEHRGTLVVPEP